MSFFHYRHKRLQPLILAAILLCVSDQDFAQSGRRTRTATTPSTAATPEPDSRHPAINNHLQRKTPLLIGRQSTNRQLPSEDTIFASFVNRLHEDPNIHSTTLGEIKSDDAVKRAKAETEAYVVLLHFSVDSFQSGTIILNSPDLQVEYTVLAPRTGKKLTKGKIYFQSIGGGRLRKSGWPGGTPIKITADGTGVEAAEHVHDWLRLEEVRSRKK